MEIQFISPEKVVTSTLTVTLGPVLSLQNDRLGEQRPKYMLLILLAVEWVDENSAVFFTALCAFAAEEHVEIDN